MGCISSQNAQTSQQLTPGGTRIEDLSLQFPPHGPQLVFSAHRPTLQVSPVWLNACLQAGMINKYFVLRDALLKLSTSLIPELSVCGRVEAEEKLAELFGDAAVVQLKSSNWKDRLTSMEFLLEHVNGDLKGPAMDANTSAIIQGLSYLPGWNEKNFQVQAQADFHLRRKLYGHID